MTKEQLTKAYELNKEITGLETFIKAFNSPFQNAIRANDYEGTEEKTKTLNLSCYPGLEKLIEKEAQRILHELKRQFAEI